MLAPTSSLQAGSEASVPERGGLGVGVIVPRRALLAVALLSLALAVALSLGMSREHSSMISHARLASPSQEGLPVALRAPVSQALGADTPAYRVSLIDGGLEAANPAQRLRMSFSRSRVRISSGKTQVGLSLRTAGYGSSLQPVGAASAGVTANRVIYRHRGMSEWFANGPLGLEQGFTVASTPSARRATTLTLSLGLSGNVHVAMAPTRQSITLSHRGGPSLRYAGLTATDASGRALHSWFELRGGEVLLRVDARHARYPLRIDPLFQQARLTGTGETGSGWFGRGALAVASDGNTALVGALKDNNEVGAAWVFVRSGSTWMQQGPELTGSHEAGAGRFGSSVALSADGNTALIGGEDDNVEVGAAWVFTRSGANWTQQGKKLSGSGEVGTGRFGASVALSGDGNTALIGGPGKFENGTAVGAAWVFTRSGGTWSQQGEKLTGTGESGQGEFGVSAALSADGNTALIGARLDNASAGAAYVFTRSGGIWTQQGEKLKGAGEIGLGELGESVALSAEGNTALVGGAGDNEDTGAAWVFLRSGSTWSQQGEKLTGNGEVGPGQLGQSVALSSNGNTALIGGPADNVDVGAAWLFARSGANWTQQGEKLTAVEEFGKGFFGFVALSSEATTALIAAPLDSQGVGAAWVFVAPMPPTVETGAASAITKTSATLNASVNPNGNEVTECKLEYGTTASYGSSAPCTPAPGSGGAPVAVSASVTGLSEHTTYHFRVSATHAVGASKGEDKTFTTLPPAPTVASTAAAAVTRTLATLNGTVNPNGATVSDCHFDYGSTTSYGSTAPCSSLPGSGESAVAMTASLGNLSPATTYHYRVSATNAGGTSTGSDQSFTTLTALPTPHWYKNGVKVPLGEKAGTIGWGTLTLESSAGTVTCHSAQAANVENTAGAATKETVLFGAWECKPIGGSCTGGEQRATPRHLPWMGTMLEEGLEGSEEYREEGWGIELNLKCFKGGVNTANQLFKTGPVLAETGTSTPAWLNGTTATKPSEVSFDASSGHLDAEVEGAAVKGTTKGKLKFVGYQDNAGVPLITLARP